MSNKIERFMSGPGVDVPEISRLVNCSRQTLLKTSEMLKEREFEQRTKAKAKKTRFLMIGEMRNFLHKFCRELAVMTATLHAKLQENEIGAGMPWLCALK